MKNIKIQSVCGFVTVISTFILFMSGCGQSDGYPPGPPNKFIYFTPYVTGNLGGLAGADATCVANIPKGITISSVKALISEGTKRIACTSANCTAKGIDENVDWVLAPNTTYIRIDKTIIGTTNSAAIFSFPLLSMMDPAGAAIFWSGLNTDFTSGNNCTGWTNASANGNTGAANILLNVSIDAANSNCTQAAAVACVEQ